MNKGELLLGTVGAKGRRRALNRQSVFRSVGAPGSAGILPASLIEDNAEAGRQDACAPRLPASPIEDNAEAGRQDACAPRLPASPIEDNAEAGRQDACAPRLRLGDVSCRLCSDADLKRATRMATTISDTEHVSTDNLDLMLAVLPKPIRDALERAGHMESLIEVVLDLGRRSEARYTQQ